MKILKKLRILIVILVILVLIKYGLLNWLLTFFFGFTDFKIAEINFDIGSTLVGLATLYFIVKQNKINEKQAAISEDQAKIMKKQNKIQNFQTEFNVLKYNLDKMESNEFYKKLFKWMRNEENNKTSPFPIPFIPYLVLSKNKLQEYIDFMQIYSKTNDSGSAYILKIYEGEERTSKMKKSLATWFDENIGIGDLDFMDFIVRHTLINSLLFTEVDKNGIPIATDKIIKDSTIQRHYHYSLVGSIAKFVELSLNPDAKPWS